MSTKQSGHFLAWPSFIDLWLQRLLLCARSQPGKAPDRFCVALSPPWAHSVTNVCACVADLTPRPLHRKRSSTRCEIWSPLKIWSQQNQKSQSLMNQEGWATWWWWWWWPHDLVFLHFAQLNRLAANCLVMSVIRTKRVCCGDERACQLCFCWSSQCQF